MSERQWASRRLAALGALVLGTAGAWLSCASQASHLMDIAEPRMHPLPMRRAGLTEVAVVESPARAGTAPAQPAEAPAQPAEPPKVAEAAPKPAEAPKPAPVAEAPAKPSGTPVAATAASEAPKPKKAAASKPAEAASTEMGSLNLTANAAAEVWIDGKRVGKAPIQGKSVSAGAHRVRFDCVYPSGKQKGVDRNVEVQPFSEVSVDFECPEQPPEAQ